MADDALTDAVARAIEAVDDRAWLNAGPSAKSVPCDYQRYAEATLAVVREHTATQVAAAKAEGWAACVLEAEHLGWMHDLAADDMAGRNPYITEEQR